MSYKVKPVKNPGQHMADCLVFGTESDAISCLENMKRFLKTFGRVSIDILYTMAGALGFEDPPYNVGWTDLSKAYIVCKSSDDTYDYYKIIWPSVKLIDSTEDLKWAFKEDAEWLGTFKKGTTLI
jgi:hypothetical protein